MGRDRIRDTRAPVRRSLRVAAFASVVLLISWAPPATEGPQVPIDDDPFPPPVLAAPNDPSSGWSAGGLSEEADCYYIYPSPVPGGGVVYGSDHTEPSCHHEGAAGSKATW